MKTVDQWWRVCSAIRSLAQRFGDAHDIVAAQDLVAHLGVLAGTRATHVQDHLAPAQEPEERPRALKRRIGAAAHD